MGREDFQLTDRGREVLASNPAAIDVAFLKKQFAEFSDFTKLRLKHQHAAEELPAIYNAADGTWNLRTGVEERVRGKLELAIPNEETRHAALSFLAFAMDNADQERSNAWYISERRRGLRLIAGRWIACGIAGSHIQVSVIGPVRDEVRAALGADAEGDYEFKQIPGGMLLRFPAAHAAEALSLLKDGLASFIEVAMASVRRSVSLENHVPEAVAYMGAVLGRELPQPIAEPDLANQPDRGADEEDKSASREPFVRGRAPIFELGQRSIASLMDEIEREVIALPDLQRPFVWEDTGVRQLLDSLFVGFPVGTLVFWHTSYDKEARAFGRIDRGCAPRPSLSMASSASRHFMLLCGGSMSSAKTARPAKDQDRVPATRRSI